MNTPVIHLREAYMCPEEHISNNSRECPVCSSQVMCLARVLDREEKKETK